MRYLVNTVHIEWYLLRRMGTHRHLSLCNLSENSERVDFDYADYIDFHRQPYAGESTSRVAWRFREIL